MKNIKITLPFLVMLFFQVADIVSTAIGLRLGFVETNAIYNTYGAGCSMILKFICVLFLFGLSQINFNITSGFPKTRKIRLKFNFDWAVWGSAVMLLYGVIPNTVLILSRI